MMRLTVFAATLAAICACSRTVPPEQLFTVESRATPAAVAVGARGRVQVDIKTRAGAHLSEEAPLKLSVDGRGVTLDQQQLSRADSRPQPDGTRFEVPFTAQVPGAGAVEGEVTFFICTDTLCERQSRKVSVPVQVQ